MVRTTTTCHSWTNGNLLKQSFPHRLGPKCQPQPPWSTNHNSRQLLALRLPWLWTSTVDRLLGTSTHSLRLLINRQRRQKPTSRGGRLAKHPTATANQGSRLLDDGRRPTRSLVQGQLLPRVLRRYSHRLGTLELPLKLRLARKTHSETRRRRTTCNRPFHLPLLRQTRHNLRKYRNEDRRICSIGISLLERARTDKSASLPEESRKDTNRDELASERSLPVNVCFFVTIPSISRSSKKKSTCYESYEDIRMLFGCSTSFVLTTSSLSLPSLVEEETCSIS